MVNLKPKATQGVKKPSASDRTVEMFQPAIANMDQRAVEAPVDEEKANRVPMEQDVDRMREKAFTAQEWATKAFGIPDADGNQYRVSHRGAYYYLETLAKAHGVHGSAYGYVGLMVHERDLYAVTQVLVQAVRDKQKKESANG